MSALVRNGGPELTGMKYEGGGTIGVIECKDDGGADGEAEGGADNDDVEGEPR